MRFFAAIVILVAAHGSALAGGAPAKAGSPADWPMFRGAPDLAGVARSTLPARPRLLWAHEAGSSVESTAAIVGERVFVGTQKGEVICLDLKDGKRVWAFAAAGPVSASPCVVGGTVYIGDEEGNFYFLKASTGRKLHRFKTDGKIISSATPGPGVVLFGSYDNHLYCLDATSGRKRWAFKTDSYVHCSPCVAGGLAIVAGCDSRVRMISLDSGKEQSHAKIRGNFAACAAYSDGHIFVGDMSGTYRSVRCKDGRVVWEFEDKGAGSCYAGAAVAGDRVVFASRSRKVFCLDRKTGAELWSAATKGEVDSSPVIVGKAVYVGCADGELRRLRLSDGKQTWKFSAGAAINASPAVARGRLVIGTEDGAVYCFGAK